MSLTSFESAGGVLTVDLGAIVENWHFLRKRSTNATCAAVVKADAYGLGMVPVAGALALAGCNNFFVAHVEEGLALKPTLPKSNAIYVLHGVPPGAERLCQEAGLVPVLNSLQQIEAWAALARRSNSRLPAVLQVDTGMSRVGLSPSDVRILNDNPSLLEGIAVLYVMSHLACAEQTSDPRNARQLENFKVLRWLLPLARASLANSSGIFLGEDYHFDLLRPGAALYGVAPVFGQPNPMRPVVHLQGKVVQVREIEAGTEVGYGGSWTSPAPTRIATISVGYADGFLRSLSNQGRAFWKGIAMPLVGKVSMDTITLDASAVPEGALQRGTLVDLIDERHTVDAVARQAGTIAYEVLTSLGKRYFRRYLGGEVATATPHESACSLENKS